MAWAHHTHAQNKNSPRGASRQKHTHTHTQFGCAAHGGKEITVIQDVKMLLLLLGLWCSRWSPSFQQQTWLLLLLLHNNSEHVCSKCTFYIAITKVEKNTHKLWAARATTIRHQTRKKDNCLFICGSVFWRGNWSRRRIGAAFRRWSTELKRRAVLPAVSGTSF